MVVSHLPILHGCNRVSAELFVVEHIQVCFHHFEPHNAAKMLHSAVQAKQRIAIVWRTTMPFLVRYATNRLSQRPPEFSAAIVEAAVGRSGFIKRAWALAIS